MNFLAKIGLMLFLLALFRDKKREELQSSRVAKPALKPV
jgi:hypothetical protein